MKSISAFDAETRRRVKRLVDARAREKMARPAVERTRWLDPPTEDREVLSFGDRIREVRLAAGLSQNAVARRARPFLCAAALNRIEAGSRPNPLRLQRFVPSCRLPKLDSRGCWAPVRSSSCRMSTNGYIAEMPALLGWSSFFLQATEWRKR
jgi:hypothetical protein